MPKKLEIEGEDQLVNYFLSFFNPQYQKDSQNNLIKPIRSWEVEGQFLPQENCEIYSHWKKRKLLDP